MIFKKDASHCKLCHGLESLRSLEGRASEQDCSLVTANKFLPFLSVGGGVLI